MSDTKSKSPNAATLDLLKIIHEKTGQEDAAQVLEGGEQYDPEDVLSTGSVALDYHLGNGGWKRGGIVHLFGPEKSGKTSMCLFSIFEDQQDNPEFPVVFFDYENSLDPNYMKKLGIDTSRVIVVSPETLEEGIEIIKHLLQLKIDGDPTAQFSMMVFDSIAEAIPKETVDKSADEESSRAKGPRIWAQQAPIIGSLVRKAGVVFLFTNQARDDQSTSYVKKDKFPGGRALRHKFQTSVRCETFNTNCVIDKKTKEKLVHGMTATIEKNKWSGKSSTRLVVHWVPGERVDNGRGLLELAEHVEGEGFTDMPVLYKKSWDKSTDEPKNGQGAALVFDEDILEAIRVDEPDFDDEGLSGKGFQYERMFLEFLREHPALTRHLCSAYLELLNYSEDWDEDEGEEVDPDDAEELDEDEEEGDEYDEDYEEDE